jgi:two-component sensor histidine kinase
MSPHSILYIDDDAVSGRLVQRMLARQGYTVEHFSDPQAALQRLSEAAFDVVILDHDLGPVSGLEVMAEISQRPQPPSVVYLTASAEVSIAVEALKAGAMDYVVKTVGPDFEVLLTTAIKNSVEKAALRRAQEQAEAEMREARDRAVMLLAEVNHRVGNSLMLIASLVRLQIRSDDNPKVKAALSEIEARIAAIASLHRSLYTSDDVRSVDLKPYLQSMLNALSDSLNADRSARTISLNANSIVVPTDAAVSIGVITAELVTNAIKYAYPDSQDGQIRVQLLPDAEGKITLAVEDDGIGWTGKGDIQGTGLGSKVISAMSKGLNADFAYEPRETGTRAVISFAEFRPAP